MKRWGAAPVLGSITMGTQTRGKHGPGCLNGPLPAFPWSSLVLSVAFDTVKALAGWSEFVRGLAILPSFWGLEMLALLAEDTW